MKKSKAKLLQEGDELFDLGKFEEAIEKYKAAAAVDKKYEYSYYAWAEALLAIPDHFVEAVDVYRQGIAVSKDKATGYYNLGEIFRDNKQYDEAIEQYQAAIAIESDYENPYYGWAESLLAMQDRFDEAVDIYRKGVEVSLDKAAGYYNLGEIFREKKRYDEAIEQYKASIAVDKSYTNAFNGWGLALEGQKKYNEAIEQYKAAIAIDEYYADAHNNWGAALNAQKKYDEAIEQYKAVIAINENYVDAYNNWGLALEGQKKYDEAIEQYKAAIAKDNRYFYAHFNWALALDAQKKYDEAIEQYKAVIAINENYADAYNNWGLTLAKKEDYTGAIEKHIEAIKKDEKSVFPYLDCADALQSLGRNEDAFQMYNDAIQAGPTYAEGYRRLGWFCQDALKDYDQAEAAFRQAVNIAKEPSDLSNLYNDIGNVFFDRKKYAEAIENYEIATRFDPDSFYPTYNIALVMSQEGKYREAITQWKEALKKFAKNEKISAERKISSDYRLSGWIAYEVFQSHELGESLYKIGLEIDPENLDLQQSLLNYYIDQKEQLEYNGLGSMARQQFLAEQAREIIQKTTGLSDFKSLLNRAEVIPFKKVGKPLKVASRISIEDDSVLMRRSIDMYSRAMQTLSRLEDHLKKKLANAEKQQMQDRARAPYYLNLAKAGLAVDRLESARKDAQKALELDDQSADAHSTLGAILMRLEEYRVAILSFKNAVDLNVDDFSYRSNLAEAYRKAGMLDEAKKEYEIVLKISPHHLDSIIGMGETYTAMGDGPKDGKKSVDAEEMYTQAIEYYSRALRLADSDDASKVLTLREMAAIRYARGYARVMLSESQSHHDERLLRDAQRDFESIPASDKNYQKAKRAAKKLAEKLRPFSPSNLEQKAGSWVIAIAIFAFLVGQFMFFVGQPTRVPPGYAFTGDGLEALKVVGMPEDLLVKIALLVPDRFNSQQTLVEAVSKIIGDEMTLDVQKLIAANIEPVPASIDFSPVDVGYYALFTFGPLIFVVAGAYLQQISRLKFAGIEIEKSSVDQISTSSLGIGR